MRRIRLEGDHSRYHCGSAAAFEVLWHALSHQGSLVADDSYDSLYINGEGSMHDNSAVCVAKMESLDRAVNSGRSAHLINSVWQNNDSSFDRLLRRLSSICVREPLSQADLRRRHAVEAEWRLDAAFYAAIDENAKVEAWNEQIVSTDFYAPELSVWFRLARGPFENCCYVDMRDVSWSTLVKSLSTASLLITGRHHAIYAACRARVPFLAVGGNSHKIRGLIAASGLPIPVLDSVRDLAGRVRWARQNPALYDDLFHWMQQQPAWTP